MALAGALGLLSGCSSASADGGDHSRQAYDALRALGADCTEPRVLRGEGLPYLRLVCDGLQIEWIDDREGYEQLWRDDCVLVPPERRASMEAIAMLRGSTWIVRGNGEDDVNAWPSTLTPQQAVQTLGGQVQTAGDYCRTLGAWTASS